MSPWVFNLYMDGVMKELMIGVGGRGNESGGEWNRVEGDLLTVC